VLGDIVGEVVVREVLGGAGQVLGGISHHHSPSPCDVGVPLVTVVYGGGNGGDVLLVAAVVTFLPMSEVSRVFFLCGVQSLLDAIWWWCGRS
jgi:hypothetical protein